MADAATDTRCGFIVLIGAPNAGKSTLTNALTGSKVAIVTPKVQTTRALIRGIAMVGNAQLVLIDTPGIFAPKRRLDRAMVTTAWSGAHDADLVAVLIDAKTGLDDDVSAILHKLAEVRQPKVLVLNKVDIVDKPKLLALAQSAGARTKFEAVFMVSARTGDGVEDLKTWLMRAARRWDRGTIRKTRGFTTRRNGISRPRSRARSSISSCIRNCRTSRRSRPNSGPSARTARCASSRRSMWSAKASVRSCSARRANPSRRSARRRARISPRSWTSRSHLFLFVKVREGWGDDPERYREMGLEFPKE